MEKKLKQHNCRVTVLNQVDTSVWALGCWYLERAVHQRLIQVYDHAYLPLVLGRHFRQEAGFRELRKCINTIISIITAEKQEKPQQCREEEKKHLGCLAFLLLGN